jgi:hypothetical protein
MVTEPAVIEKVDNFNPQSVEVVVNWDIELLVESRMRLVWRT